MKISYSHNMNNFYSLPPQTIFVPDLNGRLFSVPLITADTVRQVLRCNVSDDTHRIKLETALISKYFPLSLVPIDPALDPSFFPMGTVVSRPSSFQNNTADVYPSLRPPVPRLDPAFDPKYFSNGIQDGFNFNNRGYTRPVTIMPPPSTSYIVKSTPSSNPKPKVVLDIDDEVTIKLEPISCEKSEEEVSLKRKAREIAYDDEETVVEQPMTNIPLEIRETEQDPQEDSFNSDFRVMRSPPEWVDHPALEQIIVFNTTRKTVELQLINGPYKYLKCHHIESFRMEVTGSFDTGRCDLYSRSDNSVSLPVLYDKFELTSNMSKKLVKVIIGSPVPKRVDIKSPMIKQLRAICTFTGAINSVVKVRIKVSSHLLSLVYLNYGIPRKKND